MTEGGSLLLGVCAVAVMLIGKGLAYVMKLTLTGWFDKALGGLLGAAKALILIIIIHLGLNIVLPPENKMLTSCRTCNALNKTSTFTLDLIKDKDIKKVLSRQHPNISAQDVKDFFTTPPKKGPEPDMKAAEKSPPVQ